MLDILEKGTPSLRSQLEEIMDNVGKNKKTRRGKKKGSRFVEDNHKFDEYPEQLVSTKPSKNRNSLRPSACLKAPFNSTQFIMDDKFVEMDQFVNMASPDEFLCNRTGFTDADQSDISLSPVSVSGDNSRQMASELSFTSHVESVEFRDQYLDEDVYQPMWIDEDGGYMGQDFERQFYAHIDLKETVDTDKMSLLRSLPRSEIVQKYRQLEKRQSWLQKKMSRSDEQSRIARKDMDRLEKENAELRAENEKLKQLQDSHSTLNSDQEIMC